MSDARTVSADVLIWHPASETELMPDVALPFVTNSLVTDEMPARALFIAGFGESVASGVAAVTMCEQEGLPAAAAWLSYSALPVSRKNLDRISIEAPQELAKHVGRGERLHMFTHSLGCLGISAAVEAPELFDGVGAEAPYAFSSAYGRLPLVGSNDLTRLTAVAVRLGVQTPLQLRHHWRNKDVLAVGKNALAELRTLGLVPGVAVRYALSPGLGRRVVNGFVDLSLDGHAVHAFVGEADKLVPPHELRSGLWRAAYEEGVDLSQIDEFVDGMVDVVPGAHSPWCSTEGQAQLAAGISWLKSLVLQAS